jgi:hypothetical protein
MTGFSVFPDSLCAGIRQFQRIVAAVGALSLMACVELEPPPPAQNATPANAMDLRVDPAGRRLLTSDGAPFFYLADTAWSLFHRTTREEADDYLADRAARGFTVVHAVALAEHNGLKTPNAYGDLPLIDLDPAKPNDAYFRHVDYIVDSAARQGLHVGLLPTWGHYWSGGATVIFTPENARAYGAWLGQRYRDKPVVWVLGGDGKVETETHKAIIEAMAGGLRDAVGHSQLITFHPYGKDSSARHFHDSAWLDFNMVQSGHTARDIRNDLLVGEALAMRPPKPAIDAEARYEDHMVNWKPDTGRFDAYDVRQAGYWAVLAGAFGHVYGDHNVWQFNQSDYAQTPVNSPTKPWREALSDPGAVQMGIMKRLFLSRDFSALTPSPALIVSEGAEAAGVLAAQTTNHAIIYAPHGETVAVDLDRIAGKTVNAWWFDPRTGVANQAPAVSGKGRQAFDPPGEPGPGADWVLVLDNAAYGLSPPG